MKNTKSYFRYGLPDERIAQRPIGESGVRTDARLLHVSLDLSSQTLSLQDERFARLVSILRPGDLLVLNDSRVLFCRFFATLERNSAEVEVLLVRPEGESRIWQALARPMKKLKPGDSLQLCQSISASVLGRSEDGSRIRLELDFQGTEENFQEILAQEGGVPIPPYIRSGRSDLGDRELYQTVYGKNLGSVAAHTAGLHFTTEYLSKLKENGIAHAFVTLHMGPASFQPVMVEDIEEHPMLSEQFLVPAETRKAIAECRARGGRVVAVGTSSVRALESADLGREAEDFSETELCISPGYEFSSVDAIVTNFHQPGSTHLLLVAAFIGESNTEEIYQHALDSSYRFLSYGDSMFLEKV